ncbi:amidohydrolase family protein [Aporhodopirellula aestuarii]|uniref:Amidohydrolase family protein n=1 Tax=Aporhodopirellula aestuarii TaxID=2950107 RepID=A0ABT0U6L2_9BACT|nr:amidohydrolase family protein [Aporhodopirellula aestuarii]MCM2372175.1 amidohydrolase family protein [Aporhodopirellula aestuarii]
MLIDSHHHLWKYDPAEYGWINDEMSVLKQDFLAPQLREIAGSNDIDGFVSIQARQIVAETRDLLKIAATEPLIRGVIGWVPFAEPDVASAIDEFADNGLLKGFRHVVQDEPDDRFLDGTDFNAGMRNLAGRDLVYDLLVFPKQLPAAIDFADRHPDIPMVLDHIAKPAIESANFDETWRRDFCELARRDHVSCKFSGVATEVRDPSWSIETLRPYWDVALEAFGTDRLMYGSDWPVCLLATEYTRWLDTVRELAAPLSNDEQENFFAGNATRAYRLA